MLPEAQKETIEPLLPALRPWSGKPRCYPGQVVEGFVYRYLCGIARRDVSSNFGRWQTIWKRHRAWGADGTRDRILPDPRDRERGLDWSVAVRVILMLSRAAPCRPVRCHAPPFRATPRDAAPRDDVLSRVEHDLAGLDGGKHRPLMENSLEKEKPARSGRLLCSPRSARWRGFHHDQISPQA